MRIEMLCLLLAVSSCSTPQPRCDSQSCDVTCAPALCIQPYDGGAVGGGSGGGAEVGGGSGGGAAAGGGSGGGTAADGGAGIDGGVDAGASCTSLNQAPVGHLTSCEPGQLAADPDCALSTTTSFSLGAIRPHEITLSGINSTDDSRVVEYRFTLLPPPSGGVSTSALANHGQRTGVNKTTLTIPGGATGTFRIGLEVWDDCGQKSSMTEVKAIHVSP